jgi:N-acetylglucosamine kinase-like BadF-type ATPase
MKSWGLSSREQLTVAANATPSPDFAALMPAVLSTADAGDPLARGVLTQAGVELANLAKTALRRLFPEGEPVPVAMSGGVFANSALVREVFYNSVRAQCPRAEIGATVVEPVHGALALARRGGPF